MHPATAAVSAGSLLAGFAVADQTGNRPLGGAVLVAGFAWCARRWQRDGGTPVTVGLLGTGLAAFVAAHVLAIGFDLPPYPSVVGVAAVDAAVVLAARRRPRPVTPVAPLTAAAGRS